MNIRRVIRTDRAPAAIGPYSQAVLDQGTGLVFVAGQIGIDPATGNLVSGGAEAECRQVLINLRQILAVASCTLEDIVRITLYLADMADFATVNGAFAEAFREPFPARSTVQAAALPKGARVEMEVTALASSPS
jgi:2-iminobutanoate/2-iminopropanoate deaminase